MPVSSRRAKTVRSLVWTIRIVATIDAADAVMYLADAGWFAANQIVTALVAGGIVGAARCRLAGHRRYDACRGPQRCGRTKRRLQPGLSPNGRANRPAAAPRLA